MVTNNTSLLRYELTVDGHLAVADYTLEKDTLSITRVFVPEELRGRGIAAEVMKAVVDDAKKRHLTIHPVCSYAAAYMQRNGS